MNQQTFGNAFKAEIRRSGDAILQAEVNKMVNGLPRHNNFYDDGFVYTALDSKIIDD